MNTRLRISDLYNSGIRTHIKGASSAEETKYGIRLELHESTAADGYANSQIDDYRVNQSNTFHWRANVRLSLRARFSHPAHDLSGTAGFGFWNAPIGIGVRSMPSLPAAAWFFFGGPNSNMPVAMNVPGNGWKAATMDTRNASFLALLPSAPIALPLMHWHAAYERLWPIAQRAMRADETVLSDDMSEWHDYSITWTKDQLQFEIDDEVVLRPNTTPHCCMGFVAWIDNQYMVATPQGKFRLGITPVREARSLEIADLSLTKLG